MRRWRSLWRGPLSPAPAPARGRGGGCSRLRCARTGWWSRTPGSRQRHSRRCRRRARDPASEGSAASVRPAAPVEAEGRPGAPRSGTFWKSSSTRTAGSRGTRGSPATPSGSAPPGAAVAPPTPAPAPPASARIAAPIAAGPDMTRRHVRFIAAPPQKLRPLVDERKSLTRTCHPCSLLLQPPPTRQEFLGSAARARRRLSGRPVRLRSPART